MSDEDRMAGQRPQWATDVIDPASWGVFDWKNGILVDTRLNPGEDTVWRASTFSSRAQVEYTTTWCEQQLGERLLTSALDEAGCPPDALVMDLGCGDGRYVRYLLARGYRRIVALNYELEPLRALQGGLSPEERNCVLIVCADVLQHPLVPACAEFIVAWGLLTSTVDFGASLERCTALIRPDGWFFNAEPVLEQALVYALLKRDFDEFQRTLDTRTRARMWDDRAHRYRVLTSQELTDAMHASQLTPVRRGGVSTFPSLVFGGLLDGEVPLPTGVSRESLWHAMEAMPVDWCRHVTFLSRKAG